MMCAQDIVLLCKAFPQSDCSISGLYPQPEKKNSADLSFCEITNDYSNNMILYSTGNNSPSYLPTGWQFETSLIWKLPSYSTIESICRQLSRAGNDEDSLVHLFTYKLDISKRKVYL